MKEMVPSSDMVQEGPAAATINAGSIDDYRVVRQLGNDGSTFLAHDASLDRAVVLSFLPEAADAHRERLAVASAFARASHPNLGRVHYVREGGARPYIVAAFVQGQRLDAIASPLPDDRVLDIGRGLAGALGALHAAGAAHGDVRKERVVLSAEGAPRLVGLDRARAAADDRAKHADIRDLLALLGSMAGVELKEKLSSLAEVDAGVATAEELRRALEILSRPTLARESLSENPYRGLGAFRREHAAVFFGREQEVAELVERLRGKPWLLIAGRSGAGKSSIARAGVLPAIVRGALGERGAWDVAMMVPGTKPLDALGRALAAVVDQDPDELCAALRRDPPLAARLVRARTERGLLLVVDQLGEVLTLASPGERDAFCSALERFGALAPGVRVLFTLRGDFLDRLVELGSLGRDLVRAAYILPAMGRDGLREAIVSPARLRGVSFETPAMVDTLVDEVWHHDEALPLLSFALEELWNARDVSRRVIPEEAHRKLGGAVAALARHGDLVLATMREEERQEARRILLLLLTVAHDPGSSPTGGTRGRCTAEDLVGTGGTPAQAALEALVRGRLVAAGDTYEIAHEALARVWPRLRAWRDEASEGRAVAARVTAAAREWVRLGRGKEGLGSERLLRELDGAPGALDGASDERVALVSAFAAASRAALKRAHVRRWALAVGIPFLLASLGGTEWVVSSARHRAMVARAVADARSLDTRADMTARAAEKARTDAIALFEKDDVAEAEVVWKRMRGLEEDADRGRRDVCEALDLALALDPGDRAARALYADVTLARFLAAERLHEEGLLRELRARLEVYDDGSHVARLRAPAHVRVETDPPGAALTLARYREDSAGRLVEGDRAPLAAGDRRELEPGSYLIVAKAPERYPTRYPFLVRRGEEAALRVVLPRAADVPDGMIYVPAGRTLYGSSDDEATRSFLSHQPAHDVDVGAFLIARTEVTVADYTAFLRTFPGSERTRLRPEGLTLTADGAIAWKLRTRTLAPGEPYCNGVGPCVDWSRLPLDNVSRENGKHFAEWLSRSGRLPGARLCTDREWERAARGADDRRYPYGNGDPGPNEACTLTTYGGDELHAGPCVPGTHPASASPFGVEDMTGSEWEWTAGPADAALPKEGVVRGAGFYDDGIYLFLSNRGYTDPESAYFGLGLRICSDPK
jgi:eukaryotic-like serine/threonine-protein kinase